MYCSTPGYANGFSSGQSQKGCTYSDCIKFQFEPSYTWNKLCTTFQRRLIHRELVHGYFLPAATLSCMYVYHYVTLPFCRPPCFDNKNFLPPLHIHHLLCHNNQCCFHVGYRHRKVHNSEHGVTKNMYEWRQGLTFLQFSPCLWHPPFHPKTSAQFGALS